MCGFGGRCASFGGGRVTFGGGSVGIGGGSLGLGGGGFGLGGDFIGFGGSYIRVSVMNEHQIKTRGYSTKLHISSPAFPDVKPLSFRCYTSFSPAQCPYEQCEKYLVYAR